MPEATPRLDEFIRGSPIDSFSMEIVLRPSAIVSERTPVSASTPKVRFTPNEPKS